MNSKKSNLNVEDDTLTAQELETIECKKIVEALKKSQEAYHNLFNNSEVGMFRTRFDGSEALNANEKYLKVFGWKREEVIGKPTRLHWVDPNQRIELLRKLKVNNRVVNFECKLLNNKKEELDCLLAMNLYTKEGVLDGSIINITERKQAEKALKESEEKYRTLSYNIPGMIYRAGTDWSTQVITNLEKVCGYSIDEWYHKKMNWIDLIHPNDKQGVIECGSKLAIKPISIIQEYRIITKDRKIRWVSDHKTSLVKDDGSFNGVYGIVFDITERKQAEETLRESKEKYHLLVENTPNVLWKTNEKGIIVFISSNIKEVFGFTPEDIYTDSDKWFGRIHHDDLHKVETAFQELFSKNKKFNVEYRIKRKDGKWIWLNDISSVVHEEKGERYAYGVFTDITERKLAEKSLHIANEDLRNLTIYMDTKIEEERKTLSRDIHDGLGQLFTTMKFSISSLTKGNEINEAFVKEINDIIAMTKEGIELTRTICRNLRPSLLDNLGLKEAIIEYSTNFSKLTNILCHCKFQPEKFNIDKELSLNLYRIVTELFTNVARHSKADLILLDFSLFENELIMRLEDNGIGIKTEQIFNSRSLGLIGIRERLRSWNGNLLIERNKPKGTKVIIRIPGKQFSVTNKE